MSRSRKISSENRDKYIMLGLNISYYRKRAGFSQESLAEKVGLSRSFLSAVEAPNVITNVSLETLFCIADALGVKVAKLLEFRD